MTVDEQELQGEVLASLDLVERFLEQGRERAALTALRRARRLLLRMARRRAAHVLLLTLLRGAAQECER